MIASSRHCLSFFAATNRQVHGMEGLITVLAFHVYMPRTDQRRGELSGSSSNPLTPPTSATPVKGNQVVRSTRNAVSRRMPRACVRRSLPVAVGYTAGNPQRRVTSLVSHYGCAPLASGQRNRCSYFTNTTGYDIQAHFRFQSNPAPPHTCRTIHSINSSQRLFNDLRCSFISTIII